MIRCTFVTVVLLSAIPVALAGAQSVRSADAPQQARARAEQEYDGRYRLTRTTDRFTKSTTTDLVVLGSIAGMRRLYCHDLGDATTHLDLEAVRTASGVLDSVLVAPTIDADRFLRLDGDRPLLVAADDSVFTLPPAGPANRVASAYALERRAFIATPAQIRAIGQASTATLRLQGAHASCDVPLTPDDRALIALFAERELAGAVR